MWPRRVEEEWLDVLPPSDPRAARSRRDLVRINALMGNGRIVAGALAASHPVERVAEIGAGSGLFSLALARAIAGRAVRASWVLLDRHGVASEATLRAFETAGFRAEAVRADVFDWLEAEATPTFDVIVANLFLHHFEKARLARLLRLVSRRTRAFVACEPRRSRTALAGARLLGVVGCNDVSRHDAVVSVHAGFTGREIASLWPSEGWRIEEGARGPFSHAFVARREG